MKTNQDNKCIYSKECGFCSKGKCDDVDKYNGLYKQCFYLWKKRKAKLKYEKYPHLKYLGVDSNSK